MKRTARRDFLRGAAFVQMHAALRDEHAPPREPAKDETPRVPGTVETGMPAISS